MTITHTFRGVSAIDGLLSALGRLDAILAEAAGVAKSAFGGEPAANPYRGLYVDQSEIARLLAQLPGAPVLHVALTDPIGTLADAVLDTPAMAWLQNAYDLTAFDVAVLLVAIAPDLDLRYERFYAYLQDDVTRRRPCVDLTLNLLCANATEKMQRRAHFAPEAPLIHQGLLRLIPDPSHLQPSLLAHYLKVDPQIVRLLLGEAELDERLAGFCRLIAPAQVPADLALPEEVAWALASLATAAWQTGEPLRLYFCGPAGSGQRQAAAALAQSCGAPLLMAELERLPHLEPELLPILLREARVRNAVLYLEDVDAVRSGEAGVALHDAMATATGVTIMAGRTTWMPDGGEPVSMMEVAFRAPAYAQRQQIWHAALDEYGIVLSPDDLYSLVSRFRLTHDQIWTAVVAAHNRARWQAATGTAATSTPVAEDLFAAARAQSGHDLEALARKVAPAYEWADLVLPDDVLAQFRAICERVAFGERVLGEWGFGRRLSGGKGVSGLFAGPSGAGKTMAAEVIANELQLDLYTIDLSSVVSKYIGETEKNLDRIFNAAENANAILFFDEADALFGKRSEVHDAHDRYANIEISYVLQKMEQYNGIAILATNLRGNLDEAFIRRLAFTVYFPFPDAESRSRIWESLWPLETPRAADLDMGYLGETFALSGGNIKNVVLAASFLAAADGGVVAMGHILRAVVAEYQKIGKRVSEAELMATYRERRP